MVCLILMNYMQIFDQSLPNEIVDGLFKLRKTFEVLFLPVHKLRKERLFRCPSSASVCTYRLLKFLASKGSEESDSEKCSLINPVLVNAQGARVFTTWEQLCLTKIKICILTKISFSGNTLRH